MATTQIRTCDVFGIKKGVQHYRIMISRIPEATPDLFNKTADTPVVHMFDEEIDLSTRAFDRLMRFVQRGLTAPSGETEKDGAS